MKISKRSHKFPTILTSQTLISSPDSSPKSHKTLKNPSGIRLKRRGGGCLVGKKGGPETPLLKWKFDDDSEDNDDDEDVVGGSGEITPGSIGKCRRKARSNGAEVLISARKLAAGLWQLQLPEFDGGGDGRGECRDLGKKSSHLLQLEPGKVLVDVPILSHRSSGEFHTEANDMLQSSLAICTPKNGVLYKVEPSLPFPSPREHVTKWDSGCLKTSDEVYRFYSQMKLLEDQHIATTSVVSDLQTELEQARAHINELETGRQASKKKLEQFLRDLAYEKALWRRKEHEKMRAMIADAKDDFKRERKHSQRMEIVNSKLVNELTEAKLSARRFKQNYDKERKERVLMEEVCDELAKELGEEKAEIEALKRESMKIREEVDEERRMLQMAEVWREERVQMKLIDARLTLEQKYSQLNKLIVDIEAFLRLRGITPDMMDMREVELLREASNSVNIQDMKAFSYTPQDSEDIFSIIEDLQSGGPNAREMEQSKIQTMHPEAKGFSQNFEPRNSNGFMDQKRVIEEDGSGLESNIEDEDSSCSAEGSDPSVNKNKRDSNVSRSVRQWEEISNEIPNPEISESCSVSVRRWKKSSSISRLWRSNTSNGENHNCTNGRVSNGGFISPDRGSGDGERRPTEIEEVWSSPDRGGVKGCIEWSQGIQKDTLKAKLLEARMEAKKIQLRQVLKQNI